MKNQKVESQSKNIGIWMDYSIANFIDINPKNNYSIKSEFTHYVKEETLNRSEVIVHNKEQQLQDAYYQKIADHILNYKHVLIFGPTNAKIELNNYLNKDLHFKDIKIDIEVADKMTNNEKNAFMLDHFYKSDHGK